MSDPGPHPSCAACREAVVGPYYKVRGTILCADCLGPIERQLRGRLGPGQLGRALLSGLAGSAIGIGIYLSVPAWSGVEVGVLAALIGYTIGQMVRRGGGGFGGTACRVIAVGLTYASIGVAYLGIGFLTVGLAGEIDPPRTPRAADVLAMFGQALGMPALRARWSPGLVLIIGFALWQAWRLNRPRRFAVEGPYTPDGPVADA